MEINKIFVIMLTCISLAACTSASKLQNIQKIIKAYKNNNNQNPIIPITEEMISNINYPLIEVKTNGILMQALMLPVSTRNNIVNYTSGSGQLLTIEGSVITKTNGMNINLISLSLSKRSPLLHLTEIENWTQDSFQKEYKFITKTYKTDSIIVNCRFEEFKKELFFIFKDKELMLSKVTEFCENHELNFKNLYWVNDTGRVLSSRQWLSKDKIFANIKILK